MRRALNIWTKKAYKYLGVEASHEVQYKNEKEKLKKEYLRRQISFRQRIKRKNLKYKQLDQ